MSRYIDPDSRSVAKSRKQVEKDKAREMLKLIEQEHKEMRARGEDPFQEDKGGDDDSPAESGDDQSVEESQ